ncbi:peptidoglycan D,D-transpeptidase FtsI family protein [Oribacterium sp. FC2011]|uniref:peptidoglycan D,D-transpeptidase FtsI family protein n=1 Tax=Oribacterium sp. FC2011 TaxID=1408311 RepID=UPI001FA75901|nr:penicillin-binding protein 2 [Oribacterium sp. FC2011]
MLALIALIVAIYMLVKNNSEEYNKIVLSQRQASYDSRTIPFRRGDIMDRNGTVLATSQKVYNLILDPKVIHSGEGDRYVEPTIQALVSYFSYDESELRTLIKEKADKSYVKYKKELSYDEKSGFEEYIKNQNAVYVKKGDKARIRGIWFEDEYKRMYPYGSLACNVIGFSSADGSVGTGGVEQFYNDTLMGVNGREYGYLDNDTKLKSVLKEPTDGDTVVTTINTNIQMSLEKYLNEWQHDDVGSKVAGAIVMDPKTGEILAMGSTNQFDLNNPRELDESQYTNSELMELGRKEAVGVYKRQNPDAEKISVDEVGKYFSEDEILSFGKQVAWNQVWRNVVISDTYEPGSTAKSITLAAALEERAITPSTTFDCEGFIALSDGIHTWRIRCHNHDGDGVIDAQTGLMRSCNVYLMNTAFALGAENFVKYQHIFGFGEKTGIDLPAEADTSTLVYPAESLGRTTLATNSFGQNYNVTMVQMAAAYCSIVNGGNYYKPHVVKQILNGNGTVIQDVKPELLRTTCSKSTSDFLREALYQTVEGGTGTKAKIQGYHVGGKTGTAEKIPRSAKNYLVSFIGFAPVEDPQVVVYVIVDTPNLVGEAQATASFAIYIERKIMNDALQFLNIPPVSDTDPEDNINKKLSGGSEGINDEAMGEQVTSGSDNENGESETVETDDEGNAVVRTQAPPVTDEVISGDDEGFELPDAVPNSGEGLEEQPEEAEEED